MGFKENAIRLLAQYEVGWWKAHGRKEFDKAVESMTEEYQLLYGLTHDVAKKAVELRVEATKTHDKAEEYERSSDKVNAEEYWRKTEELLRKHFEAILE